MIVIIIIRRVMLLAGRHQVNIKSEEKKNAEDTNAFVFHKADLIQDKILQTSGQ
jgi:hypothetical protein